MGLAEAKTFQGPACILPVARRELLSGLLVAVLGGCGARTDAGTLRIGSSPTGVPFSFVDPWTNTFTGSMIDIATLVVRSVGLQPDFRITPFSALIPSLLAGKIDMIAAALLRTPEREAVVGFSDPVYAYQGAVVVPDRAAGRVPNLAALRGRRVGAQVGTRFVDQLADAGVEEVATYDGLADILRDLENGRIEAGYGDAPILAYQLRVGPKRAVHLAAEFRAPDSEALCLIMRRDDPRLGTIDAAIARLLPAAIPQVNAKWKL
jgi:polar amino acid transport system substrate-binding protein